MVYLLSESRDTIYVTHRPVRMVQKIFHGIAWLCERLLEYSCHCRHCRVIVLLMRVKLPQRRVNRICYVWISFIRQERVYATRHEIIQRKKSRLADKGSIHVLRLMDHPHEGRMSLEEIISQGYDHDDCSRWCSERKPRQSFDK